LEKKVGLKPVMDNGFGGEEYEIERNQTTVGTCPVCGTRM
jgi:hypothetical protein